MGRKKKEFGQKETISIYRFMEMCGLKCPWKENVLISHEIMLRKLSLRFSKFPTEIAMPIRISFKSIKSEMVRRGIVFLVKDDYDQILPYKVNLKQEFVQEVDPLVLESRRNEILSQYEVSNVQMPIGYQKYLWRKLKEQLEQERAELLTQVQESRTEEMLVVTEKRNRYERLRSRNII